VATPLLEQLSGLLREILETAKRTPELGRVEADPDDPDQQSLLLWYPAVTADGANYARRAVKIEAGAKSALDPHGLRRWWDRRGELRGGGQRVSRHYYDVHCLLTSNNGENFVRDAAMAADCVRHGRMFFNRPDLDLATADPGSYALVPHSDMLANLEPDHNATSQMIFGEVPEFGAVIRSVVNLEERLNG
jgi:hypothetical protein